MARLRSVGWAFVFDGGRVVYDAPEYDGFDADLDAVRTHRDGLRAVLAHEARDARDRTVAETAANVMGAAPLIRRGWRREVVAGLRWLRDGNPADEAFRANLEHDREALRRILGTRACLDCGTAIAAGDWCARCAERPYRPVGQEGGSSA